MDLKHFQSWEFREWWDQMHPSTLKCFDLFRDFWGMRCDVSAHKYALGRNLGPGSLSGHNVDKWGHVYAGDLFPAYIISPECMARAYDCARRAGATGIGLYTDTQPGFMIHLDTRPDRTPDNTRLWSRVNGKYKAIEAVMPEGWER
jgi:hypothetical protein